MMDAYEITMKAEQMELILKKLEAFKEEYGIDDLFIHKVKEILK